MTGVAIVPDDVTQASFRSPRATCSLSRSTSRRCGPSEGKDFSAEVPDSAREGTKRNMLSESMLDGERFPEIVLKSSGDQGGRRR